VNLFALEDVFMDTVLLRKSVSAILDTWVTIALINANVMDILIVLELTSWIIAPNARIIQWYE